ncbi:MAG: hypothetical protein M3P96_08180 [Actinomycetota bacterium]|nr:hypothetical protein [Actinomycetota bacterium]
MHNHVWLAGNALQTAVRAGGDLKDKQVAGAVAALDENSVDLSKTRRSPTELHRRTRRGAPLPYGGGAPRLVQRAVSAGRGSPGDRGAGAEEGRRAVTSSLIRTQGTPEAEERVRAFLDERAHRVGER